MAIFRGAGGSGDATADTSNNSITAINAANAAEVSAAAAAASATSASNSSSSATTSASNATTSATNAATSATTATTKAAEASTSATNAATSATTATTKASEAATSASSASTSASTATTKASEASTSATSAAGSATTATTQATNASSSATSASGSATTATTQAGLASTSATNASTSASAAATSATNAATSATAASGSASTASTQATNAAASATTATTQATNASSSATSASGSATTATTQAGIATTKAGEASTSATNAAASATTASTQATNAASSATSASGSATTATTQAGIATTGATTATTQATNASTSATSAAGSATTATTQAGIATTQATNASTSATTATTQAGIATTQATNSATSAAASAAARDAALAALDSFDDRYLGTKSADPTLDNDGNALVSGALYFNSSTNSMKVYDGSVWLSAYASLSGALLSTNNLNDLTDTSAARTNLGLGTLATQSGTFSGTSSGTNTGDQTNISGNAATATNVAYSGLTGTVPTWNQNTTGTAAGLSSVLAVSSGGTGTATPSLVAGSNITISGTFPNQTITGSAAGVTSVSATSPIASTGGFTPTISIPQATTSVSGYLTSTDWNTFNGKYSVGGALGTPSSGTLTNCTFPTLNQNTTGSSGSCTGNAATATSATSLNASNYISQHGSDGSWNADFQNTPNASLRYNGDVGANTTSGPGNTWWFQQNFRHNNASNYWGTQVAWGWEDNANRLATRNVTGGTFGAWVYYLNSANYTSYAPSLTGSGASGTWGINVTGTAASISGYNNPTTATTGSTIVYREVAGYINGTYFNQSSSNNENPTVSQVMVTNGSDGYLRKASIAHLTSSLSGTASGLTVGTATTATKLTTASGSAPSYSARAWVNFNGQGTIAIRASGNVSSITDVGAGRFTLNFTTAMQDTLYAGSGITEHVPGVSYGLVTFRTGTIATGSVEINTFAQNTAIYDPAVVGVLITR
jgi:hypothetical protein